MKSYYISEDRKREKLTELIFEMVKYYDQSITNPYMFSRSLWYQKC